MTTHRRLGFALAALVFALDQFTKYLVMVPLDLANRGEIEIMPIFRFLWVNNAGVSMGMLQASTPLQAWLLVAMTVAIAIGVTVWLWRERNVQDVFGLGLVLGGALGNITDRMRFGHVIDFANLHFGAFSPFLVFNGGDAAITVGVLILLFRALLVRDKTKVTNDA